MRGWRLRGRGGGDRWGGGDCERGGEGRGGGLRVGKSAVLDYLDSVLLNLDRRFLKSSFCGLKDSVLRFVRRYWEAMNLQLH